MGFGSLFSLEGLVIKGILLFVCIPVHEWAHAYTAYKLGDDTAAVQGRLTLNPMAHLDPMGAFLMLFSPFGWGKPVPVSRHRLRGNMRASWAIVAVAGPFSNLVLAMLAAIPFRMGWLDLYAISYSPLGLSNVLDEFIYINLSLMLFNLLPIPPLDGSRLLGWLLPRPWADAMDRTERYAGFGLIGLVILLSSLGLFSSVLRPALWYLRQALL